MSGDGTWEPPRPESAAPPPGAAPPPPPDAAPPPPPATVPVEPVRPGRSRGPIIAAVVGAVALVGAGVFAVSRIAADGSAGGASTPEAAGEALLAALDDEDVLGVVDLLLPGERETLRDPMTDLVDELQRIEVLSSDADLSGIAGVDLQIEGGDVAVVPTNVDDIVNLQITAGATLSVDGEELPIGDLVLDNSDVDPSEMQLEESDEEVLTIPMTAVREDGRWYLSAFYTIAEAIRSETDLDVPDQGIAPLGGESPEDAMDDLVEGIAALDLTRVIASLNPEEFQALQRYAPLFLPDAQAALDEAGVTLTVDAPEYTVSGSGDSRSMTVDFLRATFEAEGEQGTMTLEDGCWTVEAEGQSVDSCQLGEADMPQLDDMFEDPQSVEDALAALTETFADYENPGFIVSKFDGRWFFSPMATTSEQLLAVLRAVSREEIEDLQGRLTELFEQISEGMVVAPDELLPDADELIEDYSPPGETQPSETLPSETFPSGTVPIDEATDSTEDPTFDCYGEADAADASKCFLDLAASGAIESEDVPFFLRFPECGLAQSAWDGEYYSLPDAEFVALATEVAPCFQEKVASGEMSEFALPLELVAPECLQGRNWYTASDDEDYLDEVLACAGE